MWEQRKPSWAIGSCRSVAKSKASLQSSSTASTQVSYLKGLQCLKDLELHSQSRRQHEKVLPGPARKCLTVDQQA